MATAKKNNAADAANKAAAEKAAAEKKDGTSEIVKVPALSVTCSREGFRRGGRVWGKDTAVVKLSELSEEQIAQIKGEALLTVAQVEVDEEVVA